MTQALKVLIFLALCVYTESQKNIRMQRDFSYPTVNEFNIYWNVPTILCRKHGIDFEPITNKFGIITNTGDSFRGNQISILYDPGLFPAVLKNEKGKIVERNGGIPQLGNITSHLDAFRQVVEKVVPQNFDGVGIIDFEIWRPIFRQNWNEQAIYKNMSKDLVRQHHPQWPEKTVETYAGINFEEASRVFFENTLKMAKYLRPKATWGYYGFPYCYNYRNNKEAKCSEVVEIENDRIQWLFEESTALYPSLYVRSQLSNDEHRKYIIGRLNEAWRVASRVSPRNYPRVYPYVGFKHTDNHEFLSDENMYIALETTRRYKMGGAILWGSTADNTSSKEKCQALLKYLNNTLGPAVAKVRGNKNRPQEQEAPSGNPVSNNNVRRFQ